MFKIDAPLSVYGAYDVADINSATPDELAREYNELVGIQNYFSDFIRDFSKFEDGYFRKSRKFADLLDKHTHLTLDCCSAGIYDICYTLDFTSYTSAGATRDLPSNRYTFLIFNHDRYINNSLINSLWCIDFYLQSRSRIVMDALL